MSTRRTPSDTPAERAHAPNHEGDNVSQISVAVKARQTKIAKLQSQIETELGKLNEMFGITL